MATIKSEDRFKNEEIERNIAWNILRSIPEYQNDYDHSLNLDPQSDKAKIQALKEKWSFYPLIDYRSKYGGLDFMFLFYNYKDDVTPSQSSVSLGGLEMITKDKEGNLRDIEDQIISIDQILPLVNVEVDITKPTEIILDELKIKLKNLKALMSLPKFNSKKHDHLEFLSQMLYRAGIPFDKITKYLMSEDKKKLDKNHERIIALKKQLRRFISSVKSKKV